MSTLPGYVARLARTPQILAYLQAHPNGMPLAALAARFELPPDTLRADLIAFFMAEVVAHDDTFLGLSGPAPLEFTNSEGVEIDPNEATWVRVVDPRPTEELGAEYLSSSELGLLWGAATALATLEPANEDLASAIEVLTDTLFEGVDGDAVRAARTPSAGSLVADLRTAIEQQRRVKIRYSRAWQAGEGVREVEPYLLVQTSRGWELDAGALSDDGETVGLRTFLLSNIRELDMLEQTFERPLDLLDRLDAQRVTERVRLVLPHEARWAADMYAESVSQVADDERTQTLDLELLPPVERRVGLMLLAAGEESRVVSPRGLMSAALQTASDLLAHHRQVPGA